MSGSFFELKETEPNEPSVKMTEFFKFFFGFLFIFSQNRLKKY